MSDSITSVTNPKVKHLVKLRSRRDRDIAGSFIIEGYRELSRALAAGITIDEIYSCDELYLGENEPSLVDDVISTGAVHIRLEEAPFRKVAYRGCGQHCLDNRILVVLPRDQHPSVETSPIHDHRYDRVEPFREPAVADLGLLPYRK